MHDRPFIVVAGIVFLVAIAFPVWHTLVAGGSADRPVLAKPVGADACVESKAFMAANHMDLLNRWRDEVVRDGDAKPYVSGATGKSFEKSLTRTCLGCHTDTGAFCNKCHQYADVVVPCWDCHLETKGK